MGRAVIVSYARTGLAKSGRGAFNDTHGAAMTGHAIQHAVARAKVENDAVEDVVIGCGSPEGATGHNIARLGAVWAGLDFKCLATTVNRFC
jgi:acetyl-CoA C-acetyltransferase